MYVYVDLFLGLNVLLNSFLFFLTAKLCGARICWYRILLAAAFGGIYALSAIFTEWVLITSIPVKFLISLLLVWIALRPLTLRSLLQMTAAYYLASFVTGGAVAGWHYYRQTADAILWQPVNELFSWGDVLCGVLLAAGLLFAVKTVYRTNLFRHVMTYQVVVDYAHRQILLTAMLDTGNSLYSAGRKPVVIAEYQALTNLLSPKASAFFSQYPAVSWLEHLPECQDKEWLNRVQIIPFRALGEMSALIAFRPDLVRVHSANSFVETSDVLIGVYAGTLSDDHRYTALLHPALLHFSGHKEVKSCVSPG